MGFLGWIVVGLLSGTIAKAILKDRAVGGWFASLIIGVIGAWLGGLLGSALLGVDLGDATDLRTWLLAIAGSLLVLVIYSAISGSRSRS